MKPLDCITVGLSLSESDQHLLSYAAMLARMGVGKKIQFVHVVRAAARSTDSSRSHRDS